MPAASARVFLGHFCQDPLAGLALLVLKYLKGDLFILVKIIISNKVYIYIACLCCVFLGARIQANACKCKIPFPTANSCDLTKVLAVVGKGNSRKTF